MFLELPLAAAAMGRLLTELNEGIAKIRADATWKQINDQWGRTIGVHRPTIARTQRHSIPTSKFARFARTPSAATVYRTGPGL